MKLQEIYELGVAMGIKADPRGEKFVRKSLEKRKKTYEELSDKEKKYFDQETLTNPYSDSRLLNGDPKIEVKKALVGIDADATEVLLVDRLNEKGQKIDLLIGHHPEGHALAGIHDVLNLQIDLYAAAGVPVNVAEGIMRERITEVERRFRPLNHNQVLDTARLLNVPLMALHTIWDNLGDQFMRTNIQSKEYDTLGEILDAIKEIPEFIEAIKGKSAPQIVAGTPNSRPGKIEIFFTGGTNPSKEMYAEWAKAGIGTIIDMHPSEDTVKEMKKMHVNLIDCGHIASDSIGANLFLDELEKRGVEVIPCSGLIRVKRSASSN